MLSNKILNLKKKHKIRKKNLVLKDLIYIYIFVSVDCFQNYENFFC